VQPGRPVVLPPGQRWQSVWQEQADVGGSPERDDRGTALWAEQEARFDEREGRRRG